LETGSGNDLDAKKIKIRGLDEGHSTDRKIYSTKVKKAVFQEYFRNLKPNAEHSRLRFISHMNIRYFASGTSNVKENLVRYFY
jgi:hypothetical protein